MLSLYGNPHSRTHAYGWETEEAVEKARKVYYLFQLTISNNSFLTFILYFQQIADLIKCDPKEVIFTSGATESNNIAIKGTARFYNIKKKHLITTQTVRVEDLIIIVQLLSNLVFFTGAQMCVGFLSSIRR